MTIVPLLFGALYAIQLAGIATKPSPNRWMYLIPISVICCYLISHTSVTEPVIVNFLVSFDYLVLTDVQHQLRLIGQKGTISDASLWERLKWAFRLITSVRCVGWSHEPTSALPPRRSYPSRARFLVSQVMRLLGCCLLFDIGQILRRHNPSFQTSFPPIATQSLFWRTYTFFTLWVLSTPLVVVYNLLPSIILVATGFSEPNEWPPLFGSVYNAYTVRNFWGRHWHQLLRRIFTSHGKYLTHNILNLQRGSRASYCVQVFLAFFLSGIVHTRNKNDAGALVFFILQAVAIVFEDIAFSFATKLGLNNHLRSVRWLGYAWVWCWFLWSFPWFFDALRNTQAFEVGADFTFLVAPSRGDWLFQNSSVPFVPGVYPQAVFVASH